MPDLLPGAVVFGLGALVLLAWSAWMTWRAVRTRSLLRESFAVILLGFSGALAYETSAYYTGREPTISLIVSREFALHPLIWLAFFLPVIGLGGALTFHFVARGRQARWWVFAAGAVCYLLGGLLAWQAGWLP